MVESWSWKFHLPQGARESDWQDYRPLRRYRHLTDITSDEKLRRRLAWIEYCVASGAATKLLIHGETGTGKEIIARWVHRLLAEYKLREPHLLPIKVISPGVNEDLAQSTLFGHCKGAFTGADEERDGAMQLALGGLLLIDDLQEIPVRVQAMLLRALEYGELERLGSQTKYSFSEGNAELDLFLVCTINRPISTLIAEGKLLRDLYFRLIKDGLYLPLPPLRDRRDDALQAARDVWQELSTKHGIIPGHESLPASLEKEDLLNPLNPLLGNFRAVHSIVREEFMKLWQIAAGHAIEEDEISPADLANPEKAPPQQPALVPPPPPRPTRGGPLPHVVHWIMNHLESLEELKPPARPDDLKAQLQWIAWACRRFESEGGAPVELQKRNFEPLLRGSFSGNKFFKVMTALKDEKVWVQVGENAQARYLLPPPS
jgi:hypothetical protein